MRSYICSSLECPFMPSSHLRMWARLGGQPRIHLSTNPSHFTSLGNRQNYSESLSFYKRQSQLGRDSAGLPPPLPCTSLQPNHVLKQRQAATHESKGSRRNILHPPCRIHCRVRLLVLAPQSEISRGTLGRPHLRCNTT